MALFEVKRIEKPWGHEIIWAIGERYVGKILHVAKGHKLSWQYHEIKDETIYLLSGSVDFETETEQEARHTLRLLPGQAVHVEPKRRHRLIAREDSDLLEASTPEIWDVVRLSDDYGRQGSSKA